MRRLVPLFCLCLWASACGGPPPPPPLPKLSALQAQVFSPNCTFSSCHSSATAEGHLVLESGRSFQMLVGKPSDQTEARLESVLRVQPGDPDHSFLVMKLQDGFDSKYGKHMPDTGQQIDQGMIDSIAEWIRLGAHDD